MTKIHTGRLADTQPEWQELPKARTAESIRVTNAIIEAFGGAKMVKTNQSKKAAELPGIAASVKVGGIVVYSYDMEVPEERAAYEAMAAELKAANYKIHESWGPGVFHRQWGDKVAQAHPDGPVPIDMTHPFDDQWNTVDSNLRVHEWAQDYPGGTFGVSRTRRCGYYLKGIEKLKAELAKLSTCGYCGNFGLVAEEGFCRSCVGSSYLKEQDLALLVMRPVGEKWAKVRPPEYKAAIAKYLPQIKEAWMHAQLHSLKVKPVTPVTDNKAFKEIAALRARAKKFEDAATAWEWLYARNINTENIIYYDHSNTFSVGWRSEGLDKDIADKWRELLKDFPADYEIKERAKKD